MSRLTDIWLRFTQARDVLSVEHCFVPSGTQLNAVEVKRTKRELVQENHLSAADPMSLKEQCKNDLPVVLGITGRKVLSKKVETKVEESLQETAVRAFTNLDLNGLHFERQILGEHTVVSAIRKDTLEQVLEEYSSLGFCVVSFTLGVFPLFPLLTQLGVDSMQLGHHAFDVASEEVKLEEQPFSGEVKMAGESIDADNAVAYLFGLSFFTGGEPLPEEVPKTIQLQLVDWRFKTAYKQLIKLGGISLLLCLLISFFTFSQYYDKNQKLQAKTAGALGAVEALNTLKLHVKAKEEFLKHNVGGTKKLSEVCDKIGASVPKAVVLESMGLFPLEKMHKRTQLFEFAQNSLELKGECTRYMEFQLWMQALKELPFVEKIEIMGFGETEQSAPEKFHLRLSLRI